MVRLGSTALFLETSGSETAPKMISTVQDLILTEINRTLVVKWRKEGKTQSSVSTTQGRTEHCEVGPETRACRIECLR